MKIPLETSMKIILKAEKLKIKSKDVNLQKMIRNSHAFFSI